MIASRQLLANLASTVVPTIIVLLTIPAYVHILGPARYGVLAIVWILFGYAGVLDLGMSPAVNSAISRTAKEQLGQRGEIIWSAAVVALCIGIAVSVLVASSLPLWHYLVPDSVLTQIAPAVPVLIAGIPLLTVTSILNGAIEGARRFDVSSTLQITAAALYQAGPLAVAYFYGPDLAVLIIAVVASRAIVLLAYLAAHAGVFRVFSNVSVKMDRIRHLIRFGYGIALVNILDPLLNRTDQFAVAYLTGPAGVAAYNIAVSAVQRMTIVPMAMARTIFPVLSAGRMDEYLADLIKIETRVLWGWFAISAAAIAVAGPAFRIWLGPGVAEGVTVVARVLLSGLFLNAIAYLPFTALQADGRGVRVMRAHLIELPIFLAALAALALLFGAVGAAIAWSFRAALDFFILWLMCGRPARSMAISAGLFAALLVFGLTLRGWGA